MSRFEERLLEKTPEAAKIVRGLRQTAGIIDEIPLDDFEVCSLQKMYEAWEALMEKDYVERRRQDLEQMVDVKDISKYDVIAYKV